MRYGFASGSWTRACIFLPEADIESGGNHSAFPIFYVNPETPPILLMHGTVDDKVSYEQSAGMAEALVDVGVPSHLVTLEALCFNLKV
jgi:dipeptidyl aminopeptidase/acylaminoacyl peptidase